jgi:hypothetical protein
LYAPAGNETDPAEVSAERLTNLFRIPETRKCVAFRIAAIPSRGSSVTPREVAVTLHRDHFSRVLSQVIPHSYFGILRYINNALIKALLNNTRITAKFRFLLSLNKICYS